MTATLRHLADFLRGKKTYLVSAATLVYGAGIVQGFWRRQPGVDFLLMGGGLASVRAAVGNVAGNNKGAS